MDNAHRFAFVIFGFALLAGPPGSAEIITFDEFPAANNDSQPLKGEYAYTGARFRTTDDGAVWGGMSAGDPGGWGLEGSQGPQFMGFDGASLRGQVNLDGPADDFRMDVARGVGSRSGDTLIVLAYLDGVLVESLSHRFGGLGSWGTVSLTQTVDRVVWFAGGTSVFSYAVDHLRWIGPLGDVLPEPPEPELLELALDVEPWSERTEINLRSRGLLPIALLGSAEVPAEQVDLATLEVGPGPATPPWRKGPLLWDANGDGLADLLVAPWIRDLGLTEADVELCMTGALLDGREFIACDDVRPVTPGFWKLHWGWRHGYKPLPQHGHGHGKHD